MLMESRQQLSAVAGRAAEEKVERYSQWKPQQFSEHWVYWRGVGQRSADCRGDCRNRERVEDPHREISLVVRVSPATSDDSNGVAVYERGSIVGRVRLRLEFSPSIKDEANARVAEKKTWGDPRGAREHIERILPSLEEPDGDVERDLLACCKHLLAKAPERMSLACTGWRSDELLSRVLCQKIC
jgi:hypothetical protein